MPTLFEKMWNEDIECYPVLKSEQLGVMAVVANPQETEGQLVVFNRRPVPTVEELTVTEEINLMVAVRALTKHMKKELGIERVVRHVEGYGVPSHAHTVLLPSYERGDSDKLHHPGQRVPESDLIPMQQKLLLPQQALQAELDDHQLYVRRATFGLI